jgi:hypothetical protein
VFWNAVHDIAIHRTLEECQAVLQHNVYNAFADIEIGDPHYKIFGSVPTDPMHSLCKGIMECSMNWIFDCMTDKQKIYLDELAKRFDHNHHQTACKSFPQTIFSNGVTSLAKQTAAKSCSQVFLLVCLSKFDDEWSLLNNALMCKGQNTDLSEVLEALEAMSCFDAWTRIDSYWKLTQQRKFLTEAHQALSQLLSMLCD